MESRRVIIASASAIAILIIAIAVARVFLGRSQTFFLIAGAGIAGIIAIIAWAIVQHHVQRRILLERQLVSEGQELRIEYSFLRKVAGVPTKFQYKEIEEATDNFQAVIGRGSSGCVFKGILGDGTAVAVKRIEWEDNRDKGFRSEVAAISSVQHVNLVRLLGYCCVPRGPRFLIYEFIHYGSLDNWIFPQKGSQNSRGGCLSWSLRYRVAIHVAKALAYLHHDCRSRILHLDVKPENILLDESFRAIVSDFGLSKLMGRDVSRVVTTVRGTRGYLAPEWLLQHGISEKSDIYSYGMVLFEIIGGRRNVRLIEDNNGQKNWTYFPKIVAQKLRENKLMEVIDERLVQDGSIDEREVRALVLVALWCIQETTSLRPSMTHVVEMLEGRTVIDVPPETEMIIVDLLSIDQEPTHGYNRGKLPMLVTHQMDNQNPPSIAYSLSMSVLSAR